MRIAALTMNHERALVEFVQDFTDAGEASIPAFFRHPDWSHAQTVAIFDGWSRGVDGSPESSRMFQSFVPSTTRFLCSDDGEELLGVMNLRHALNERLERFGGHVGYSVRPSARRQGGATRLLREALSMAPTHGISRALVTCEPTNLGSVKAIEACGGRLEDETFHEQQGVVVRRYWIELT